MALATPAGMTRIDVTTAQQMHDAIAALPDAGDIFIGVAAVADYRPSQAHTQKIKKRGGAGCRIELVQNPDIIATVAKRSRRPFVVGFAAETHDTIVNARAKLARKGLDMIVLNDVSDQRIGFDSNDNAVTVITADSEERIDIGSKTEIARALIARIATALDRASTHQRTKHAKRSAESDTAAG